MEHSSYEKIFRKGEILFREDEHSFDMYIIKSGKVEIILERLGEEVLLGTFSKGDIIGEMSLFDKKPRSATARIVDDAEITIVSSEIFKQRLNLIPKWVVSMINILVHRLRQADKRLGDSVIKNEMLLRMRCTPPPHYYLT